jgi:NAD(P)-dependent dehydrogenase (short-subunit alcohol dehydrogenase family)
MFDFSDQVVVVTGAAGNLGGALARAFDAAGAHLVLVDHKPERLEALYPEWASGDRHLLVTSVNLSKSDEVQAMVEQARGRFGRIDVLVNAAGGYAGGKSIAEAGLDDWEALYDKNLRTSLVTTKAVLPGMLERQSGRIVNIGARTATLSGANAAAYSAAKLAVHRLTEALAAETKAQGITVNCVLPSTIASEENRAANPKADPGKWVTAASLAEVILFLASPAARDITGALLPVYGRV